MSFSANLFEARAAAFGGSCELLEDSEEELQYAVTAGELKFWITLPRKSSDLRLLVHFYGRGGSLRATNLSSREADAFRKKLLRAGFFVVSADCGPEPFGNELSTTATLQVLAFCKNTGLPVPEKFPLLGCSMGGLSCLMFCIRRPEKVFCAVDVFGITDLERFIRENRKYYYLTEKFSPQERCRLSPQDDAGKLADIPLLLCHGKNDEIVNISHSGELHKRLEQYGNCEFMEVPGYGHENGIFNAVGCRILAFLQERQNYPEPPNGHVVCRPGSL